MLYVTGVFRSADFAPGIAHLAPRITHFAHEQNDQSQERNELLMSDACIE